MGLQDMIRAQTPLQGRLRAKLAKISGALPQPVFLLLGKLQPGKLILNGIVHKSSFARRFFKVKDGFSFTSPWEVWLHVES